VNLERLRWGEWIAAIFALNLLLVTFRSWYKVSGGGHVTAWDALETGRYLLLATALAGIFLWLARAAEDTPTRFPIGWVTAALGLACTVYIAYRLATPPADNLDADIGIYLGLASALGVTIGGLLSAREPEASYSSAAAPPESEAATEEAPAPYSPTEPAASTSGWSPAAPAASTSGWSPASPAASVPPATAAGAVSAAEQPLRSGDSVVLTAGGARFPAGTVAEVVEAFAGGALVEVKAADGVGERFEVPESAYERAPAGGESWSPAMPAPAGDDWGFDDSAAAPAAAGAATGLDEPAAAAEPKAEKVPWWKREIGGGKKKKEADDGIGAAGAVAAGAAGAAAVEAATNGSGEEKPGFFKRLFGGGGAKAQSEAETLQGESTPATDVAGIGQSAESDTSVDEPAAAAAVDAPAAEPEPAAPAPEPEPEVAASEPEPPAAEPEPVESEPEPPAPEPEPAAAAPEPEPESSGPDIPDAAKIAGAGAAGAGAPAAAGAASNGDAEDEPKPARKRSSGSRKVPKEALAAAQGGDQPKVGDEVQLKVGGGKFNAGTKGTVVDVFSAGVIVELSDDDGRTERLDLPFEAIGPAEK
jgi:hypothetical protein